MWRILLACVVVGVVLGVWGFKEFKLTRIAQAEPQEITCAELEANGYGDNAHVVVTEFMGGFPGVFEQQENKAGWTKVWQPIASPNIEQLADIRLVIISDDIDNESALAVLEQSGRVQGLIVNDISSLGGEERDLLESSFAGVDFDEVYLLEHGRAPKSAAASLGLMGGGAALVLVGIGVGLRRMGAGGGGGGGNGGMQTVERRDPEVAPEIPSA